MRSGSSPNLTRTERIYSASKIDVIDYVQKHMTYVHFDHDALDLTPAPKVLKTKFTPYSGQKTRDLTETYPMAIFTSPWYAHMNAMDPEKVPQQASAHSLPIFVKEPPRMGQPYQEEDFEWLQAFLAACAFMAKLRDKSPLRAPSFRDI